METVVPMPTALSIIVVPFLQITLLAWVMVHARAGRRAPYGTGEITRFRQRSVKAVRVWRTPGRW